MNAPKTLHLYHREDCTIDRQDPVYPAAAVLYDSDGEVIRTFDQSWTDAQIWAALDFANQAYDKGHRHGQADKAREVRRVLDVPDLPQTP